MAILPRTAYSMDLRLGEIEFMFRRLVRGISVRDVDAGMFCCY
jgi:hypothetical protein